MSQEEISQSESTEQLNAIAQKDYFTPFFCIPICQNILANHLTYKEWLTLRQINKACLASYDHTASLRQVFTNELGNETFAALFFMYASLNPNDVNIRSLTDRFIEEFLKVLKVKNQRDSYRFFTMQSYQSLRNFIANKPSLKAFYEFITHNPSLKIGEFLDDLSPLAQKTLKTYSKNLHRTSLPNLLDNYVNYLNQFVCALKNNKPFVGCDLILIPESSKLEDFWGLPGKSLFAYGIQGNEFYYIDKQENTCIRIENKNNIKLDQMLERFQIQKFPAQTNKTFRCLIEELDFNDLKKITIMTGHVHLANHYQFYPKNLSSSVLANFTDFFKLFFHFQSILMALCICYKLSQMRESPTDEEMDPAFYLIVFLFNGNYPLLSRHCLLLIDTKFQVEYIVNLLIRYEILQEKRDSCSADEHTWLKEITAFFNYLFTEEILIALVKNSYNSDHKRYIDKIIYTSCFTLPQKVFLEWGYPDRDTFSLYQMIEEDRLNCLTDEQLITLLQAPHQEYKGLELLLDFLRREYKKKPYLTSRFQKRLNSFILNKLLCDLSEKFNSSPEIGDRPPYDFYYYFFFVEFAFSHHSTLVHFTDDSIYYSFQMTHHYWFLKPYSSPYWINFTERQLYETPKEFRLWYRLIKNSAFRARLRETKLIYPLALLSESVAESLTSRKQKTLLRNLNSKELATLAGEHENEAPVKLAGQKHLNEKLDQSPEITDWRLAGKYVITLGLLLLIGLGVILCATGAGTLPGLTLLIASFLSIDVTTLTLTMGCLLLFLGGTGIALTWIENPITQLRIKLGFIPPYVITPNPHIPTAPQIRPIIQSAHSTQNQQAWTTTVSVPISEETSVASSSMGSSSKPSPCKKMIGSDDNFLDGISYTP